MDMGEKDKSRDHMNYSPALSSDWKFDASNLTNTATSMGLVQPGNSIGICPSSCSSAPMADGFVPAIWDHPNSSQSLGFCDGSSGALSAVGMGKGGHGSSGVDVCWAPPNSMLKGGAFLPNLPGVIPPSLSQLPADSAFIERAARFSSFNGGNFGEMMNPFVIPQTTGIYMRNQGMIPGGGQEVFTGGGLRHGVPGMSSQRNELCANEGSRDASVAAERANNESPLQNERKSSRSLDEAKPDESDEAELSSGAGAGQDESVMYGGESSGKELSSKKRKRLAQDSDPDRAKGALVKEDSELLPKGDQNPSPKTPGKNGKQGSQASDPMKEDYIHVRARRGQATNSHSLAERVRREKISERMKFLQDLVPGCSKVTGKAVMLDEIINYVQSLQRQVEFLSMKLATVNPRLDFNIEGLLTKDMLQSRVVSSSPSLTFAPDMPMTYPSLQQGLIQPGFPGMGGSSDALRRAINSHLTPLPGAFKEPSQVANMWEDELNNVVQMRFGARTSPSSQDGEGSLPGGHMKVEL